MISQISIVCFAASYAVALALEVTRLFFHSGPRRALTLAFTAAGLLAHTLFLAFRAANAPGIPLSSSFDWYLVAAWLLAAMYLYLAVIRPKMPVGVFLLPVVLALVAIAEQFADEIPFPPTRALQIWGAIHGGFQLLGAVAVIVGFVAGAMYLLQAYRLKHKLPPAERFQLPSLEWLERVNSRAIVMSVLMLGIGYLSGTVLNLVTHAKDSRAVPWTDPVVWSSAALLAWMIAAAVFSRIYRPARQGRKVAYLTVATFLFLLLAVGARWLLPTQHGNSPHGGGPIPSEAASAGLPGARR